MVNLQSFEYICSMQDEDLDKLEKVADLLSDIKSRNDSFEFCLAMCDTDSEQGRAVGHVCITPMMKQIFSAMMENIHETYEESMLTEDLSYSELAAMFSGKNYEA